jgi:Txe/YoeB family toxin of Txe-Axe toxin-antitoxin module
VIERLAAAGLKSKTRGPRTIVTGDPSRNPPLCGKIVGDFAGVHGRRIDIQRRPVDESLTEERVVRVLGMWPRSE